MSLTLQEYGLPLDICLMIEKNNYKENFKLVFEELIKYIDTDGVYKLHEFYFIQILPFIKKLLIPKPTFSDNFIYMMFQYDNTYNYYECHYLLYKDHMNHFIYQKNIYNIYYNPI